LKPIGSKSFFLVYALKKIHNAQGLVSYLSIMPKPKNLVQFEILKSNQTGVERVRLQIEYSRSDFQDIRIEQMLEYPYLSV